MDRIIYACEDLRVEPSNRRLTRDGRPLALEPRAFSVLQILLERADDLVRREELLDAVWGHRHVTPATLNRVMAILRRALEDDADSPRLIQTVHGAGYRFVGQLSRVVPSPPGTDARFAPPWSAQLPARLEALVGRQAELAQAQAMLSSHRALTVVGPGGIGKTQCALELARRCADAFADGAWFFDLSPLVRVQEWLGAFAAALALPAGGAEQTLRDIAQAMAGRDCLLVIDNCDRMAADVGRAAFELLRACPGLKLLATSQQPLDFVGEHLLWLPPLALPPAAEEARWQPLADIAACPAVALLLARAATVQPSIALGPHNLADIVEICLRLDGMPLALELAAAQFAVLSPAAIRERLRQRFDLLCSGSAGRERRHQTLRALVDWSYSLLSQQEQRLLCWLGVFLQGWTLDAAEHVGAALGIAADLFLELHAGLVRKSLVVVDPAQMPPRYRLLETVREFALERLSERGEQAPARAAHLELFMLLAESSHRDILAGRADEWLQRLRHEHANIDAAIGWACAHAAPRAAWRLTAALMLYGKCQGHNWLLAQWVERALDGAAPEASRPYARALLCSGLFRLYVQDPMIEARLTEAITLAARLDDRWTQGCASAYLAMWNAHLGRLEPAVAQAGLAREIADSEGDDWLRSLAGLAQAWIALRRGDHRGALAWLEPLRGIGFDLHQHMMINIYAALAHHGLDLPQSAAAHWLDVMRLSLQARNLRAQGGVIEGSAYLALQAGQPQVGARLLGKAAEIRARSHAPLFSFWIGPHERAMDLARQQLSDADFSTHYAAGGQARDERLVEETMTLLSELSGSQPAQGPNRP